MDIVAVHHRENQQHDYRKVPPDAGSTPLPLFLYLASPCWSFGSSLHLQILDSIFSSPSAAVFPLLDPTDSVFP